LLQSKSLTRAVVGPVLVASAIAMGFAAVEAFVSYRPEEHQPDPGVREAYDEAYVRYRKVYASLKPVFSDG